MSAPLRVGVLGVGSLGFHHARILREVPGARMVGVHDASPERTAAVSQELGVPGFGSSWLTAAVR
ncbi:MAG TPA: Gfo/Idh/MocA family oxidoreductase, partial [Longimicrobium sp.]|nr:Gfo/Idh/MocA family oxidoreductase [Longimicrobium sp.]